MSIKIYHNPRCSKSRDSFNLLNEKGIDFETLEYLKTPPNQEELEGLLRKLDYKAEELIRKSEPVYKEHFKGKTLSEEEWIKAMLEYPKLIERPIIIVGDKAVVARPIEKLIDLLESK
jgi:arsenate reductase